MKNQLPPAIADLCGILMREPRMTTIARGEDNPPAKPKPIDLVPNDDGTWSVLYFGKLVGTIQKINLKTRDRVEYRALSIHNDLMHLHSLKSAQDWLMSNYH